MSLTVYRDSNGTAYTIPASPTNKAPGGRQLPGTPELHAWWARRFVSRSDETLIIKQENMTDRADVIELTLGQVYDLIAALNKAIENT